MSRAGRLHQYIIGAESTSVKNYKEQNATRPRPIPALGNNAEDVAWGLGGVGGEVMEGNGN